MGGISNFYFTLSCWEQHIGPWLEKLWKQITDFLPEHGESQGDDDPMCQHSDPKLRSCKSWSLDPERSPFWVRLLGLGWHWRHLYSPDPDPASRDQSWVHSSQRRGELLTPWKIREFNFISSSCQMWTQLRSWRLFNGQLVSQKSHFELKTPPPLSTSSFSWRITKKKY